MNSTKETKRRFGRWYYQRISFFKILYQFVGILKLFMWFLTLFRVLSPFEFTSCKIEDCSFCGNSFWLLMIQNTRSDQYLTVSTKYMPNPLYWRTHLLFIKRSRDDFNASWARVALSNFKNNDFNEISFLSRSDCNDIWARVVVQISYTSLASSDMMTAFY